MLWMTEDVVRIMTIDVKLYFDVKCPSNLGPRPDAVVRSAFKDQNATHLQDVQSNSKDKYVQLEHARLLCTTSLKLWTLGVLPPSYRQPDTFLLVAIGPSSDWSIKLKHGSPNQTKYFDLFQLRHLL